MPLERDCYLVLVAVPVVVERAVAAPVADTLVLVAAAFVVRVVVVLDRLF